jgi:hypothetical protein
MFLYTISYNSDYGFTLTQEKINIIVKEEYSDWLVCPYPIVINGRELKTFKTISLKKTNLQTTEGQYFRHHDCLDTSIRYGTRFWKKQDASRYTALLKEKMLNELNQEIEGLERGMKNLNELDDIDNHLIRLYNIEIKKRTSLKTEIGAASEKNIRWLNISVPKVK